MQIPLKVVVLKSGVSALLTEGSAERHGISREEQDSLAVRSYLRAPKALDENILDEEVVPVTKMSRKGEVVISRDEDPFKGNIEKLPNLRTVFKKDGIVTAGNASTISDGAAVAIIFELI